MKLNTAAINPGTTRLFDWEGKDPAREDRLWALNRALAPLAQEMEAVATQPRRPTVFVLGAPRSGTTLVSELLAASGSLGFISNLASRFWMTPALGLMIADVLLSEATGTPSFRSVRGRTAAWGAPSEFGYFWSRFFDLGQSTHMLGLAEQARLDRDGLRRAVGSMEAAAGKPMAFKNNTWFNFHADLLAEVFPGAVLVLCRRDPFFIAQSLYLQRLDLYGDPSRWWSIRPPEYERIRTLAPMEQVAHQTVRIVQHTESSVARARGANVISVDYARVIADPRGLVTDIISACGADEWQLSGSLEAIPETFETTDRVRLNDQDAEALRQAIDALVTPAVPSDTLSGNIGHRQ